MATDYERLVEQTQKLADGMSKAQKSANGLESIFGRLFLSVSGANLLTDAVQNWVRHSTLGLSIQQALSHENLNQIGLMQREIELTSDLHFYNRLVAMSKGKANEMATRLLEQTKAQLDVLQKQRVLAVELQNLGRGQLIIMGAMVTAGTQMWLNARQFNQNLIEANSSWQHRDRLIRQTLVTQAQLGIGFDEITRSAAALVHYGMDTEASFETNLRLVSQMEQGLGVSVDQSAQLASIVERQLKGSFESVSHVISQIVNDTALAGNEAARLATAIGTALGRLRPGLSAATLPEVVRLVGRYESALKEVGGQSGAFQQLLTQLTTPEGLVGAGALGVSPEFLATSKGVETVMERFAAYGNMLVGQSQGWERQMRLQALAQIFNTTADSANQMLIAIERAKNAQDGQITTQERWRQQLAATNSGIQRLFHSINGLLQGAMYPFVFAIGALATKLADGVQWLLKSKEVVYAVGIALFAGTIVLTARMYGLVRALWQVVAASYAAQVALQRQAGTQAIGSAVSSLASLKNAFVTWGLSAAAWFRAAKTAFDARWAFGGLRAVLGGMGGWAAGLRGLMATLPVLGKTLAVITGPIGIIVGLTAGILGYAAKISNDTKKLTEQNAAAEKIIFAKEQQLRESRMQKLYAAARYGEDPRPAIAALYTKLQQDIIAKDVSWTQKRQELAALETEVEEAVLRAKVTRGLFQPLPERTPAEQKAAKDLGEVDKDMLDVNKKMEKHMIQRIEQQRDMWEEENKKEMKKRTYIPPTPYDSPYGGGRRPLW